MSSKLYLREQPTDDTDNSNNKNDKTDLWKHGVNISRKYKSATYGSEPVEHFKPNRNVPHPKSSSPYYGALILQL